MATSYFTKKLRRQSKQHEPHETTTAPPAPAISTPSEEPAASPVLDEEDEKFLQRLAAIAQEPEGPAPALPDRPVVILDGGEKKVGKDAQQAIMDGADAIPLPMSPPELTVEDTDKGKEKATENEPKDKDARRKSVMSYFALAQSKFKSSTNKSDKTGAKEKDKKAKEKDQKAAGDLLAAAAEASKTADEKEKEKENEDLTKLLDDLSLSAVNNRVFSFSKESEELLSKFKLVLKDVVNGAPTAYNDMEKLFTDSDAQIKKMYGSLPPFMQNLIKSLPTKLTAALGPEIMAMQAEKPGFDGKQAGMGSKKKSKRSKIPSLKSLISAEGAVATMLKSILNFLKLRFPMVMTGTNILLSVAVFSEFYHEPFFSETATNSPKSSCSFSGTATSAAAKPASTRSVSPLKVEPTPSAKPQTRPLAAKPPITTVTRCSASPQPPQPRARIMRRPSHRSSSRMVKRGT